MTTEPVDLSVDYLLAVRHGEPTDEFESRLATLDADALAAALDGDDARLAFWLNVYNAATQVALRENPDGYGDRRSFFSAPRIDVAGKRLSLDDVEHGILRRSRPKWTLGYLANPFAGEFERRHRLDERDPRVHFALNCGAESCPPIAAYTREAVDEQLDWATEGYLERTVEYDPDAGRVRVPRVMLWFRGDFGGKSGILEFLRRYDQLPADASPRLKHREWNWSLDLGHFATGDDVAASGPTDGVDAPPDADAAGTDDSTADASRVDDASPTNPRAGE